MKKEYYLAIDIGASSGRHVLAWREGEGIALQEVHRFSHHPVSVGGNMVWDVRKMREEMLEGLKKCRSLGKIPCGIGIDTFGVDYALLDARGELIGDVFAYRDLRTLPAREAFGQTISEPDQFRRTGIQPQVFNTAYQLMADKLSGKLDRAHEILLLPCYLTYLLTGVAHNEMTIASTTGLFQAESQRWDPELLDVLGLVPGRFAPLVTPGSPIGPLQPALQKEVGFDAMVYAVGAHDTASAVLGSLADEDTAFLSSGTWSLLGMFSPRSIASEAAFSQGFTNEGCVGGGIRFLKNIMGLWMVQEMRAEMNPAMSYSDLADLAERHADYPGTVDVTDQRFLSPRSMTDAVCQALKENGHPEPTANGEFYYAVFHSLAKEYAKTLAQMESFRGRPFRALNIIGGGSQNALLNRLTAKYTRKEIIAGPVEATALGNVLAQMIAAGEIRGAEAIRSCVRANVK